MPGLKISIDPSSGGTEPSGHLEIHSLNLNFHEKQGQLEIWAWKDQASCTAKKTTIGICFIRIGETQQVDAEVLQQLAWVDVKDKTEAELLAKLKTGKIQLLRSTQILDLSAALGV